MLAKCDLNAVEGGQRFFIWPLGPLNQATWQAAQRCSECTRSLISGILAGLGIQLFYLFEQVFKEYRQSQRLLRSIPRR